MSEFKFIDKPVKLGEKKSQVMLVAAPHIKSELKAEEKP